MIISLDGTAIAAAKSCEIEVSAEKEKITAPNDSTNGEWECHRTGRKSWQVTVGTLLIAASTSSTAMTSALLCVGNSYTLTCEIDGYSSDYVSGTASCTRCRITGTRGNLCAGSFVFEGNGELS